MSSSVKLQVNCPTVNIIWDVLYMAAKLLLFTPGQCVNSTFEAYKNFSKSLLNPY